jgi:DNA anti-recombination protein RmuC
MKMWKIFNNANKNKEPVNSDEYERLLKRVAEIVADLSAVKASLENTRTDLSSLRGKFNQRLRGADNTEADKGSGKPTEEEKYISDELPLG